MLLPPPPKRLAIPEISPPSPVMVLRPPLSALATPPDAVCFSKLLHSLSDCEVAVLLLEGEPKLIPVGTVFAFIADIRVSPELDGLTVFSVPPCG